jgi:hypothetical protein
MEGSDGGWRGRRRGVCPILISIRVALEDLHVRHFLWGEEEAEEATPVLDSGSILIGDFAVGEADEAFLGYAWLEPGIPCSDLIGTMCGSTGEGREDSERRRGVMAVMEGRVEVSTCSDGSREEHRHGCASWGHDAIRISWV